MESKQQTPSKYQLPPKHATPFSVLQMLPSHARRHLRAFAGTVGRAEGNTGYVLSKRHLVLRNLRLGSCFVCWRNIFFACLVFNSFKVLCFVWGSFKQFQASLNSFNVIYTYTGGFCGLSWPQKDLWWHCRITWLSCFRRFNPETNGFELCW